MWKLILAEFKYDRLFLGIAYSIIIPILIVYVFFGGKDAMSTKWLMMGIWQMFMATIIVWAFSTSSMFKNKKVRYFTLLTLSPWSTILLRFIKPLIFWLSMIMLFWIIHLLSSPDKIALNLIWQILCLSGVLLVFIAIRFIAHDMRYYINEKYRKFIITSTVILITVLFGAYFFTIFSYYGIRPFHSLQEYVPAILLTPKAALLFITIGLFLSTVSVITFIRRKSYLG